MKHQYFTIARLTTALILAAPAGGFAQQPPAAPDAHAVIRQVLLRNPALSTFQSRVHVKVRMLNFPFIALDLDGTSYYKRPGNYEVVFDRVPGFASGLKHMFADIADPASWERDWNIAYAGQRSIDGRTMLELRMTKKDPSVNVSEEDAFVDAASYTIDRMEWHYFNGGSIVMSQTYRLAGAYWVVAQQHAEIHIPHVRAIADATYDPVLAQH